MHKEKSERFVKYSNQKELELRLKLFPVIDWQN